jgi:uncharacterized protein YegP (UPF0339 family)
MKRKAAGARFEILRGPTGLYRWVLFGLNGERLGPSEHYTTKAGAYKGVAAVMAATHAIDAFGTKIVDMTKKKA